MSTIYQIRPHQRYRNLKFAYVDGYHQIDFGSHKHDFAELFLVTGGSGNHKVASHMYPLNKGDVFVIKGGTEHGFTEVRQLRLINLMFDAEMPFFETPSIRQLSGYQALFKVEPIARETTDYQAKLTLTGKQMLKTEPLLNDIRREYEQALPGFELMLTSLLQQFAIILSRIYQQQQQEQPKTTLALSRALIFIEQNFKTPGINSESIAKAAFISQRQLERLFRHFLNTSPNHYLREMQLTSAARLMVEREGVSVQSVAEQSGFSDSNYFAKCFKAKYQVSPRQYRYHYTN